MFSRFPARIRPAARILLPAVTLLVVALPASAQPTFSDGVAPNGLPDDAAATGVVTAAPQFYDPGGGDYRPDKPAGSPLVDLAGDDAPRDGRLLNGQSQTAGGWDAGAHESHGSALPVELTGLNAALGEASVRLTWTTASETRNAGFRVQRRSEAPSASGGQQAAGQAGSWTTLGRVDGSGTTADPQSYRFVDTDLPFAAETLRYRLVQIDVGGRTTRSDPVVVQRPAAAQARLLPPAPNPARTAATVRVALPDPSGDTPPQLRVYDVLGRRVATRPLDAEGGHRRAVRLDVGTWPSGTYFVRLRAGTTTRTERLTVVQ